MDDISTYPIKLIQTGFEITDESSFVNFDNLIDAFTSDVTIQSSTISHGSLDDHMIIVTSSVLSLVDVDMHAIDSINHDQYGSLIYSTQSTINVDNT